MKKALSLILALTMVLALCACGQSAPAATEAPATTAAAAPAATEAPATEATASEGKVFNIYAWNEEFKGFFEKYYTVPEGVDVEDLAFLGSGFFGGSLFGGGGFFGLGRLGRFRGSGWRVGRRFLARAACKHSCEHQNCKKQRKILFHLNSSCKK